MAESFLESEQHRTRRGMWFVLIGATLWGTTGTTQALAPAGAEPLAVGFVRIALGSVVLLLIAAWQGHLVTLRNWRDWPLGKTLLASTAIGAYQLFFFAGVARTGVAVGTIVGIGSTPVAAGILTYFVSRTFPGNRWVFSTFLAILGCTLLVLSGGDLRINGVGILLATSAGASYALYTLISKQLLEQQPRGAVLGVTFALGTILLLPIMLIADFGWLRDPPGLLVALHLGVITVGVGYQFYAMGLNIIPVATTATLTLAEPLTAGMLGIFLLGEELSLLSGVGIILLLAGLIVLVRQNPTHAVRLENDQRLDSD